MSNCPRNCTECEFEASCDSAMYLDGCVFYPPYRRPVTLKQSLKKFFGKFFR